MASYRYERDIDPADLAPRAEKQYTRKERWANWWDYNLKWVLLIGIAAAFVAYSFIGQYFFTTKPDYNVAVVAPCYLPDDTVTALQEQLARYGEDLNGDGKTVVTLNVYTLDYSAGDTQTESVLTGLDLGEYRADTTHARGGDSQTCLADFYVGMRGAWNTGTEENLAGGEELWQALTAGAVSTVEAEG